MNFLPDSSELSEKPDTVLSVFNNLDADTTAALKTEGALAIIEIAGRDSAAAAMEAARLERFTAFLPTLAYTGTEYGDWSAAVDCVDFISSRVDSLNVYDLIILGAPRLWSALCHRLSSLAIKRYGVFSPCVGCHLYLHLIRVPLAWQAGAKTIISGERISHDGEVKINQSGPALEIYRRILAGAGIELMMPIMDIESSSQIEDIVKTDWRQGDKQIRCVLGNNYLGQTGKPVNESDDYLPYLEGFALPFAERIISMWAEGIEPDYMEIALKAGGV